MSSAFLKQLEHFFPRHCAHAQRWTKVKEATMRLISIHSWSEMSEHHIYGLRSTLPPLRRISYADILLFLLTCIQISSCPVFRSPDARRSDLQQPGVEISCCPTFRSPIARHSDLLLPGVQIFCCPLFRPPVHGVQISCCPAFRSPAARRSDLLQPCVEIS